MNCIGSMQSYRCNEIAFNLSQGSYQEMLVHYEREEHNRLKQNETTSDCCNFKKLLCGPFIYKSKHLMRHTTALKMLHRLGYGKCFPFVILQEKTPTLPYVGMHR